MFGSPRVLGLVVGGIAAAFAWVDPLGLSRPAPTGQADATGLDPGFEPR